MLAQQPEDLFLLYAMAMEYLGEGDREKAEMYFTQVIEKDTGHVPAYYQLGRLMEEKGDDALAVEMYEKGFENARVKNDQKAMREFRSAIDELMM